uniref:Uncharacterized protein n=1 Tax=Catagonus wagneri TaxID=51154 RepID=A0A8C3W9S3_9CETA
MRNNYNQLHLPSPNRPKITNRLLLRQPYSPCNCSYSHPNPLKLHRSNSPNGCPRPHILHTILPSKHKPRART